MEAQSAVISLPSSSALTSFQKKVGHLLYRQKGIFPSEMFLFYLQAQDFDADDLILESGVGFGGSTTYLALLFPDTMIASVDGDAYGQLQHVRRQLARHRNATIRKGDSTKLLPLLLERCYANKIGVLIDGPKKMMAVALASRLLQDSRVKFVAVHDLPPEMQKMGDFHSWDSQWRKSYGFLDDKVGEMRGHYPDGPGLTIFNAKHR